MEFYEDINQNSQINEEKTSFNKILAKVYLFFGLAILLSAVSCLIFSYLWIKIYPIDVDDNYAIYAMILTFSLVALFVFSFIYGFFSGNNFLTYIYYFTYPIVYGLFFSSFVIYLGNIYIVAYAFLMTALIFILMSLISSFIKSKGFKILAYILTFCVIGIVSFVLFNYFLLPISLLFGSTEDVISTYITIYFIIEAIYFVIILITIILDTYRIKKSIERFSDLTISGAMRSSLILYSDFILLFIKILRLLILLKKK